MTPLRCDREPPRRSEVERGRVAIHFPDHGREGGASYPLLHCPQGVACVARFDMDDLGAAKARRIDPPALQDCHPLLHPEQRFRPFDLREEESGPAAVARACGEQL